MITDHMPDTVLAAMEATCRDWEMEPDGDVDDELLMRVRMDDNRSLHT
jgi:hypothetical protein